MTLLNRKVDYALLILSYLYRHPDEGASAREISTHFGLSRGFVANILKSLCQEEFVSSVRGVKGGYSLARPANEIYLTELMEALDESFQLTECSHGNEDEEACSVVPICPVRGALRQVHQRIRDVLATVTLEELLPSPTSYLQTELTVGGLDTPPEEASRELDRTELKQTS